MVVVHNISNPTVAELRGEVERLRQSRQHLAKSLVDAAEQLESPGFAPRAALLDALRSYRDRMERLVSTLAPDTNVDDVSLNDLDRLIEARDFRQLADAVLEQLTALTHVDVPDFAPLALCQREASRLCELAAEPIGAETNPELELLKHQRHPLNSLIRLCDAADQLSDADWTECHDDVAATFGRQLATALTRGRIQHHNAQVGDLAKATPESNTAQLQQLPTEQSQPDAPTKPAMPANPTVPQDPTGPAVERSSGSSPLPPATPSLPPATAANSIFEQATETIFDVTPPFVSSATRLRMAAFPLEVTESQPAVPQPASTSSQPASVQSQPTPALSQPAAVRTQPALRRPESASVLVRPATRLVTIDDRERDTTASGNGSVRASADRLDNLPGVTPEVVIRLISEGRLPLALQLTRCLEQKPERPDAMPPSWLLRGLILGRHLSYSKGEIARQLEDELREFRPEMLSERNEEHRLAMSFLLRAAALPAVLLAGSATATGILRSFKIAPGFSQLYNYCSRIALYGDRLAGNLAEMFRPAGTISGASELEEMGGTARAWLEQAAQNAVAYSRTSPLFLHAHWTLMAGTAVRHADAAIEWCKWQETLSLCHRLLKPVFDGADGERNWVRQEIARLTSQVRVEPSDQSNRAGMQLSAGRGIVLPREEMQAVILEAVAIANRWLRLCHQTASGGGSPIPLEALELRDEILKRSEGVLGELTQHLQLTESPLVKAAIICCQNAVRQIQALFESRLSLPVVEPDPRHVLNADLLRFPGIELNDQWLPVNEPGIVEHELVAGVVEQHELNWRQSYEHHSHSGNHEATGRLLELDVWSGPDERESLRELRQTQIAENQAAVNAELRELGGDIATLAEAGILGESDAATLTKRLEGLRRELPRVVNFSSYRQQVGQLQSAILRQRTGRVSPLASAVGWPGTGVTGPQRQPWEDNSSLHHTVDHTGPQTVLQSVHQSCDIFSGE